MGKGAEFGSVWDKIPEGAETLARDTYSLPPNHFDKNPVFIEARKTRVEVTTGSHHPFQLQQAVKLFGSLEAFEAKVEARKVKAPTENSATIHMPTYAPDLTEIPLIPEIPVTPGKHLPSPAYAAD